MIRGQVSSWRVVLGYPGVNCGQLARHPYPQLSPLPPFSKENRKEEERDPTDKGSAGARESKRIEWVTILWLIGDQHRLGTRGIVS